MSYCQLSPPYSFPLSNGFGPLPGNVIRYGAANGSCLKPLNDLYNNPTVCGCTPDPADVQELVNFYNSTGGPAWANKTNWFNYYDYNWYGVRWAKVGSKCKVTGILLTSNQLSGGIPNLNLTNLTWLNLNGNQLIGSIPNFNLPNLTYLYLDNNQLIGSIPNFNLQNLQYLYLYANQLNGSIPNFNLPNLKQLLLMNNQLSGSIPNFNFPNFGRV